jgi:hypothetical protein
MHEHSYKPGSWWIICDRCSTKIRGEEAKHEWTGFIVCKDCFEHRHPQDFIRARKEVITPPFTRPRPTDEFVAVCTLWGREALPGQGVAGCAIAGFTTNLDNNEIPIGTFNPITL